MLIVRKVAQPVSHIETEQSLGYAVITIWVFWSLVLFRIRGTTDMLRRLQLFKC